MEPPAGWAIGDGKYALLLGTNLYGLVLCSLGYLLPGLRLERHARLGRGKVLQ